MDPKIILVRPRRVGGIPSEIWNWETGRIVDADGNEVGTASNKGIGLGLEVGAFNGAVGAAAGALIGIAFNRPGLGAAVGAGVGAAVGFFLGWN